MKTFIKIVGTILSISAIVIGLTALFTIDNAQDIPSLIGLVIVMVTGTVGGISLLTSTYPELTDLSEFDEDNNRIFEEYEREIAELREHNILLLDRYITFKSVLKSHKSADYSDMILYPNLYYLIYVEDLAVTEDELERFKEVYN